MGIPKLFKLIEKEAPGAIVRRQLADYAGKVIPIDANLVIHEWCAVGESRNIRNSRGKLINHVQGILFRSATLIELGITPLFVFDGRPPDAKSATLVKRRERAFRVPGAVFEECKHILDMMGVPWLTAPGEADAQMAYLTIEHPDMFPAAMSEDSDLLAFGARRLLRQVTLAGKRSRATEIDLGAVISALGLTREAFVDLCALLGSDYNKGTMGPKAALKAVKEGQRTPSAEVFLHHPVRRVKTCEIKLRPISPDLQRYLIDVHGLSPKKVASALMRLAARPKPHKTDPR